jgi:hypothetical protein
MCSDTLSFLHPSSNSTIRKPPPLRTPSKLLSTHEPISLTHNPYMYCPLLSSFFWDPWGQQHKPRTLICKNTRTTSRDRHCIATCKPGWEPSLLHFSRPYGPRKRDKCCERLVSMRCMHDMRDTQISPTIGAGAEIGCFRKQRTRGLCSRVCYLALSVTEGVIKERRFQSAFCSHRNIRGTPDDSVGNNKTQKRYAAPPLSSASYPNPLSHSPNPFQKTIPRC